MEKNTTLGKGQEAEDNKEPLSIRAKIGFNGNDKRVEGLYTLQEQAS